MKRMPHHWLVLLLSASVSCGLTDRSDGAGAGGKADDFAHSRAVQVVLTNPFCDVCSQSDKDLLRERSPITAEVIATIDGATERLDIAQFTFSVREIEAAIARAHDRGVAIRMAMNAAQSQGDNVSTRLADHGVDVRFVSGKVVSADRSGLQHAKFLIADNTRLITGSNNWSSTGTSINEENTMVIESSADDPLVAGFQCHFDALWDSKLDDAGGCSNDVVAFTPSSAPIAMLKTEIRAAQTSVDVLMHHLLFDDLVKVLAQAAERGVEVRIVANHGDEDEHVGSRWNRLRNAGGTVRYKSNNGDLFQLMHHKLAIIDDRVLINGSGNWSGSAFFNNYENFVRYARPDVVRPYRELFARLWMWSLSPESRAANMTAAEQHAATTRVFFGNLHAHIAASEGGQLLDDGKGLRREANGDEHDVESGGNLSEAARFAYEYARDMGAMDFLALSPHVKDDRDADGSDQANLSRAGYEELIAASADVTGESSGAFVALPSMEWNTNSAGNHVNILGSQALAKTTRDRFDHLWGEFLPSRDHAGDRPMVQLNHPRTIRRQEVSLKGSWDQIFGVNLMEIPTNGERTKKFNDYGLDDFEPLASVREDWILGVAMPEPTVVDATLENMRAAAAPYARLMEVTIGRGNELGSETAVNPSMTTDPETGEVSRFTRVHSDWDYYLLRGFELAPTAPHDNHLANWGTGHTSRTAIAASALGERELLASIDARAVYASEDENLAIRFYADDRVPMGSRVGTRDAVSLSFSFDDPDYTGNYQVNLVVGTFGGSSVSVRDEGSVSGGVITVRSLDLPPGRHFVYLEVTETDVDRMAWSAPIWVDVL